MKRSVTIFFNQDWYSPVSLLTKANRDDVTIWRGNKDYQDLMTERITLMNKKQGGPAVSRKAFSFRVVLGYVFPKLRASTPTQIGACSMRVCPLGGDADDCPSCCYSVDYSYNPITGECERRRRR